LVEIHGNLYGFSHDFTEFFTDNAQYHGRKIVNYRLVHTAVHVVAVRQNLDRTVRWNKITFSVHLWVWNVSPSYWVGFRPQY